MGKRTIQLDEQSLELIEALVRRCADYQPTAGFTQERVLAWLGQVGGHRRELLLRLASCLAYYGMQQILNLMRPLKGMIDVQLGPERDSKSVFYAALGRTAESGGSIVRNFRNVNGLQNLGSQFVESIQLPDVIYKHSNPAVVFMDDFIGTGKQLVDHWNEVLSQLVPEYEDLYAAVVAGFRTGIDRVERETPLKVISVHELGARDQLMAEANQNFTNQERNTLRKLCADIGNEPLGYGDLGALVSFAHGTPNNAPSIIRGGEKQKSFRGLLPGWKDL